MMINERGWNTWDYKSYNKFCYLHKGRFEIELGVNVFNTAQAELVRDFRWNDLVVAGPHATDGSYTLHRFKACDDIFEIESASNDDRFLCIIEPVNGSENRIVIDINLPGREPVNKDGNCVIAGRWYISHVNLLFKNKFFIRNDTDYLVSEPGSIVAICVSKRKEKISLEKILSFIKKSREKYLASFPKGDGILSDAIEGVTRAVSWNTIYEPRQRDICTPVSRDWCKDWQGALVFCWDTFFIGLLASLQDSNLAWSNFFSVMNGATEKGFVPNYSISSGVKSFDRSQPPVGAYCVWKAFHVVPDKRRLKTIFPLLYKWHRWWFKERDGNSDGLLEWGSNPEPRYEFPEILKYNPHVQHAHICAAYESGQDNSPVFDDILYNEKSNVLECSDIGLNSLYAADAEALSQMAHALRFDREEKTLHDEYEIIKERINRFLWCEDEEIYLSRLWDGSFVKRLSPVNFFPLLAGIPSRDRAEKMIRKHLLNNDEFWGDYALPTIARNDPAFGDNNYWRGRIWPPFNFLVYEGLRRYDFHDIANSLARKSLDAFLKNWRSHHRVCENYNSVNGDGTDVPNSDPLYAWGALMGYIGIQELLDINANEGLRFGNLSGEDSSITNLRFGKHIYDVEISKKGLRVMRDGDIFITTDAPAIVRNIAFVGRNISFDVISVHGKEIAFHSLSPRKAYYFIMNGLKHSVNANGKGEARLRF